MKFAALIILCAAAILQPLPVLAFDCGPFGKEGGLAAVSWSITQKDSYWIKISITVKNSFAKRIDIALAHSFIVRNGEGDIGLENEGIGPLIIQSAAAGETKVVTSEAHGTGMGSFIGSSPTNSELHICVERIRFSDGTLKESWQL